MEYNGKKGKFSGLLLCTDLDDTLLTSDKRVSEQNRNAAEYFKSEGGLFTFATGRIPYGAKLMLEHIVPNCPMLCFNGAGIYDFEEDRLVWNMRLHEDKIKILEFVEEKLPFTGIEICTADKLYFSKTNEAVYEHKRHERLPDLFADYHDIDKNEEWVKVLLMQNENEIAQVRSVIAGSEFNDRFDFIQSSPKYYEIIPKGASKGNCLLRLADMLGIKNENVIAVGDNENDLSMIKAAGVGIAVANAIDSVLAAADIITVDNNSHALAAVVGRLDAGR
ncbi:MAG: HAD family phosphatase [Oscillospiraceae bacterium]|nr:HAD family phosphatase [Oscillospiraceae bacterium]